MANCSKCGNPLNQGEKFCASCGTPAKQAVEKSGTAKKGSPTAAGAAMGKLALIVVTAACAAIVVFFFFTYFAVSIGGSNTGLGSYLSSYLNSSLADLGTSVSGMGAVFSGGSGGATWSAKPSLLLVWLFAIAMLVALYVPKVREKLESVQLPAINIPVIGGLGIFAYMAIIIGLIGLIVLIAAYSSTIGYAKRVSGYDYLSILGSTIKFHTGIGFKVTVLAQLVLLGIPFADK
jgi:ribosomal protein L37E